MITAVVLAAGAARRYGAQKLLVAANGLPLVRRSVEGVLAGASDEVIVVLGHDANRVQAALEGLPVRFTRNANPDQGLSASLGAGLKALSPATDAMLVALGDQPIIRPEIIPLLIARFLRGDVVIVAPRYAGEQGTPVLFARAVFGELAQLTGDRGARVVVERDPARVAFVDFEFGVPLDVDTPADLERLRPLLSREPKDSFPRT